MLSKKLIEHGYSYESMLTTSVRALEESCKSSSMSLTSLITKYDKDTNKVILKIPNKSMNTYLATDYLESIFSISHITEFELVAKEVYDIMTLTPINEMDSKIKSFDNVLNHFTYEGMMSEAAFRNIIDCMFKISFHNVAHGKNGRLDTLITEKSRMFIIEYKCDEPASNALNQIIRKEYYAQYLHTNVPIVLLGISLTIDESKNINVRPTIREVEVFFMNINNCVV